MAPVDITGNEIDNFALQRGGQNAGIQTARRPMGGDQFTQASIDSSMRVPPSPGRVGTAEGGSTTGEFFTPAPPVPSPGPDPMAGRFNDAFSPAGPGMIADLPGAYAARQNPTIVPPNAPPMFVSPTGIRVWASR